MNQRKRVLTPRSEPKVNTEAREAEVQAEASETSAEENSPTLGDLLGGGSVMPEVADVLSADPTLPGFEMSDEPIPTPVMKSYIEATNSRAAAQDIYGNPVERNNDVQPSHAVMDGAGGGGVPEVLRAGAGGAQPSDQLANDPRDVTTSAPAPILDGEIIAASRPGGARRYESRIRILDAWQYRGSVATAPAYVDRNWIGYAGERDPVRQIDPGPCLRVPLTPDPSERVVTICRVGDYVVHEEIVGDDGRLSEKIEVWEQGQFQKLFLPAGVFQ